MENFKEWKFAVDFTNEDSDDVLNNNENKTSQIESQQHEQSSLSQTTSSANGNSGKSVSFLPAIPTKPAVPSFLTDYPEWVKAREEVNNSPNDIVAWDSLIKLTENFLLIKPLNNNFKDLIHRTFDELLSRFPLFFGYWKKYVSVEYQINGLESSISILSRSLDSFPNSLDLWLDYVSILITNNNLEDENNVTKIRGIFEIGLENVGYQFLSHPFWDKYLEFENGLKIYSNAYDKNLKLLKIYLRAIVVPLHQYLKYLKAFALVRSNFNSQQLVAADPELSTYISNSAPTFQKLKVTDQKAIVDRYYNAIFTKTASDVAARWKYESVFKPNFFNLVQLDVNSLKLYEDYLNFEEKNGNKQQIVTLYERVLIPAAFYEKFWIKYIKWLTKHNSENKDKIKAIYERAINTFLPLNKNHVRLNYLYYLEKIKDFAELNNQYLVYIKVFQNDTNLQKQVFTKYLKFLKRLKGFEIHLTNVEIILTNYLKVEVRLGEKNLVELSSLDATYSNLYHAMNDVLVTEMANEYLQNIWLITWKPEHKVRGIFSTLSHNEVVKSSALFWVNYFNFEKVSQNYQGLKQVITQIKLYTYLPPHFIEDIVKVYISYLESNVSSIVSNSHTGVTASEIYKEILKQRADIESSIAFQHSHKSRLSADTRKSASTEDTVNQTLARFNGNVGVEIEDRPVITNQLPVHEILTAVPNLPTFKNTEKASKAIRYPTFASN